MPASTAATRPVLLIPSSLSIRDWLEPGRMALVEWRNNGSPRVLHASVDWGATWEPIEIEDRNWGDSTAEIDDALAGAMRQLG
jgi:hypothetical protein